MIERISNLISRLRSSHYRRILGIIGLCSTCFMIEACYGTPQADYDEMPDKDIDVQGCLKKESSDIPVANIRLVLTNPGSHSEYNAVSDQDGNFVFEDVVFSHSKFYLTFEDDNKISFPVFMDDEDLSMGYMKTEITLK